MGKRRKSGKKLCQPDDCFAIGPFEFARFGKKIIGRSRITPEQMAIMHERMAEAYPRIVVEIDGLVKSIAAQVSRLSPRELLHRAWWMFSRLMIMRDGSTVAAVSDQLMAMRMVDYVQSIIAAVEPVEYVDKVTDEDWEKLRADVETLFTRLSSEYQSCVTAHRKSLNPDLNMALEEFRFQAEVLWLNIRGKRYHAHEKLALLDILEPHSDVLLRLYGASAKDIANELDKILSKLTRGLHDAMEDFSAFEEDTITRLSQFADSAAPDASFDEIREVIFQDEDLANRRDKVMGELFGLDLFDIEKNTSLPPSLVRDLTWLPGEDREFFSAGEFQGWPLRIWPIMRRPFISLDGRAYCFDIFSLFDNFYRVLRRAILNREPSYAGIWNDRQKAVSEELPFKYLTRLLPGATVYKPVYYRCKVGGAPAEWHEADGLLIYEDHLFVIEVKAGAFTYTSPANDLGAHLASLKNLLESPARQGSRLVDYLKSAPEVPIANAAHQEIARLRHDDFRHITICAITLDAFTELAARAQHLSAVGIDVRNQPIWPLSIDDLRIYSEIFDNPLVFLHFIEQRIKAGQSEDVDLLDELDHIGLYLEQNNYSLFAKQIKGDNLSKLNFGGFRTPIDEYFKAVSQGKKPKPPRQKMPEAIADIVTFLANANATEPSRSELVSFLLDCAGDFRDTIANTIETALRENKELRRAKPLSCYGDMATTLYIWSPEAPRQEDEAILHTRSVMVANNEDKRPLIELEYDENGLLIFARMAHITLAGVNADEMERIKSASTRLVERRLKKAKAMGKIGRNDRCPCGNGKKYKKCHGRG